MNCIFCDSSEKFSEEHIIPESIGGSVVINSVCINCNSKFGSEVDVKLTRNRHLYDSYAALAKKRDFNLDFVFSDAYYEMSNGQKVKAAKRSNTSKVLVTKTDKNNFILDKDDEKFIIQYLHKKGNQKRLSPSEIIKVIEGYKEWNRVKKIGEEFYNELFEIKILYKTDDAIFYNIMDADTPHRFLAKACVEFAYLFKLTNQIQNIDILKSHALNGNQLDHISIFQEVHKEINPCPFHFIIFEDTQFIIGLFCQFNFALKIYWKDEPKNLRYANNLLSKKLVYCEEINGRLRPTNNEFKQELT